MTTPGHTRDHLSVIVQDRDAAFFIAGDALYSEATMLSRAIDGVSDDEGQASATLAASDRSPRQGRWFISTIPTRRDGSPSVSLPACGEKVRIRGA